MSTRSYIAKEMPNGKYKTIYCHCNGGVDINGMILNDLYNKEKKVDELLSLGNLSYLGLVTKPNKKKEHDFENRQDYVCVAYGRDRGEKGCEAKEFELNELFKDSWIEYVYVFTKDKQWIYSDAYFDEENVLNLAPEKFFNTFRPLAPAVNNECYELERIEIGLIAKELEKSLDEEM